MKAKKRLFGSDGIRGVIDQYPFGAQELVCLGSSLARWWTNICRKPTILLATDTRESNQRIKIALVEGLTRAGVEIFDTGILPTSAVSFLVASNVNLSGGIILTASHNPIFESGIKIFNQSGLKISDEDELEIERIFFSSCSDFEMQNSYEYAKVYSGKNFINYYTQSLISESRFVELRANRKILIDCANGASYATARSVFEGLGLRHVLYNASPDGTNINYGVGSEHVRFSPHEMKRALWKYDADVGIALDGDADRVVLVDRDGFLYDGDMLIAILAHSMQDLGLLSKNKIVLTQMSNSNLANHLAKDGIETEYVTNGDKYITARLIANGYALGGEQIGHIIIHTDSYHVTGDGLRTALWVLDALFRQPDLTLRDLTRGFVKWPQINASVKLGKRFEKDEEIIGLTELKQWVNRQVKDISKFECRPASTEPVYRIMIEARETPVHVLANYAQILGQHIQQSRNCRNKGIEILDCVSGGQVAPVSLPFTQG